MASEVKSLSAQTAKSTDDIQSRLTTLQSEMGLIAEAVAASREAVTTGSALVAHLSTRVEEADTGITRTSELNRALTGMLIQQRGATEEIAAHVQGIAEKATKTKEEIEAVTERLVKAEAGARMTLDAVEAGDPDSRDRAAALGCRGMEAAPRRDSRRADRARAERAAHARRRREPLRRPEGVTH